MAYTDVPVPFSTGCKPCIFFYSPARVLHPFTPVELPMLIRKKVGKVSSRFIAEDTLPSRGIIFRAHRWWYSKNIFKMHKLGSKYSSFYPRLLKGANSFFD